MSDASETIVPRWEWRAFDRAFPLVAPTFAALEPTGVHESDELYLLPPAAGAIVKVRDDLMDIKTLTSVDPFGLEQWVPTMKAAFPLKAADVATVFDALDVPTPPLRRDGYPLDLFLGELIDPAQVRPVKVRKQRVRYVVHGCVAEVTDAVADGRPTRTIAVESEDAAGVTAAVRALGLDGYVNTNYGRGLTALVAGEPARYAVIDVGTNSVKFHLAERDGEGAWRTVVDRAEITRLGEGLESSTVLSPEAIERTAVAVAGMVEEAKRHHIRAIAAVGTAWHRIADNRDDVVDAVRERAGITVDVISGEDESRLAYLAVQSGLELGGGPVVVFDTGGGSSQFTFGRGAHVDERFSLDVGAVKYTEGSGLDGVVSPEVLRQAKAAISRDLARLDDRPRPDALVAMGGAVTNMAAVSHALTTYDPGVVHGSVLSLAEIDRQIELYRSRDAADRRSIVGLQPKRADVILAGACIVRTVMEKLDQEQITVSDRGLRHGVLAERFGL